MELPPSPAPPPSQHWAMLRRVPQVSHIHLGQDDFSLALAAPPDLTRLSISQILASETFLDDRFPFVLAADPSGLLLITDSYGRATDPLDADGPTYFVWDAANVVTHRVRRHKESVNHSGNVGLIIAPESSDYGPRFMVVELLPVLAGESITILCYMSDSSLWVEKRLSSSMPDYPWSSANVFSYNSKLWWVDLRHGILSCDPLADTPQSLFVQFPGGAAARTTPLMRRNISKHRCVNLSEGKLRFLEMTGSAYMPRVAMWTLVDAKASAWELDYDVNLRDIWADESYGEANLQKKRPVLAGIHPADPAVAYFLNKEKLFGVNLGTKKVDECVAFQPVSTDPTPLDIDEESSRFLLTWDLPPSLTSSSGRMHREGSSTQMNGERLSRDSAFDMVNSFMNAYTGAFGILDLEYDELVRIAIVRLNQGKKKEENKFRLSERHLLCYFDEKNGTTSAPKRYKGRTQC